jgi:hypothetical protein
MDDFRRQPPRFLTTRPPAGRLGSGDLYRRETRIMRDRMAAHQDRLDAAANPAGAFTSARQLVQVYNGGSMPNAVPRVFLTHPVILTGSETEGSSGGFSVDTSTTVPVVVIGSTVPSIGDYLTAYAVGDRWVAERGSGSGFGFLSCSPCGIPLTDLTLSWTNISTGNGSTTLFYPGGVGPWTSSGCPDNGLEFSLACTTGTIELKAFYFVSGSCPTGTTDYCSNLRSSPRLLDLIASTCSPFSLTFQVNSPDCPTLFGFGNSYFVVTL